MKRPLPPQKWSATLSGIPTPAALQARLTKLKRFIAAPGFSRRVLWMRDYVAEEVYAIKEEAYWEVYRVLCMRRDRAAFVASRQWVIADAAETEAELLETLSQSMPRQEDETLPAYLKRLRLWRKMMHDRATY